MSDQTFGKSARDHWDDLEASSAWREITAEQYRTGTEGGYFSEAWVTLSRGRRHCVVDCELHCDAAGNVVLYVDHDIPLTVPKTQTIEIR